jgi:hypothetical protein
MNLRPGSREEKQRERGGLNDSHDLLCECMIVSKLELRPQREIISRRLHGRTCVYQDIMHFDSIDEESEKCYGTGACVKWYRIEKCNVQTWDKSSISS